MLTRSASITAVLLALTATSSSAALSFKDNELFRVIYDGSGVRQIADLGSVASIMSGGPKTFSTGSLAGLNITDTKVSYFALDRSTAALWVSGTTAFTPRATDNGFGTLVNGSDSQIHTLLAAAIQGAGGVSLSALLSGSASSVDQSLYYFDNANSAGATGIAKASVVTSAGSTEILPTPLPPAIVLMGSGLLGALGLRRKQEGY